MSALGQERTLAALEFMCAIGGKADEIAGKADIALVTVNNKFGPALADAI